MKEELRIRPQRVRGLKFMQSLPRAPQHLEHQTSVVVRLPVVWRDPGRTQEQRQCRRILTTLRERNRGGLESERAIPRGRRVERVVGRLGARGGLCDVRREERDESGRQPSTHAHRRIPCVGFQPSAKNWGGWIRTSDLPVNSRALCQLSYTPKAAHDDRARGEWGIYAGLGVASTRGIGPHRRSRRRLRRLGSVGLGRRVAPRRGTGRHVGVRRPRRRRRRPRIRRPPPLHLTPVLGHTAPGQSRAQGANGRHAPTPIR
jgi:hypothetical protein